MGLEATILTALRDTQLAGAEPTKDEGLMDGPGEFLSPLLIVRLPLQ